MAQTLNTGYQRAAKNARIRAGTNSDYLAQSSWNCEEKGDDIDTANFESGGYHEGILGFIGLVWSFGGLWDAHVNYLTDPPGIYPRDDLANLLLYTTFSELNFWNMPKARVRSAKTGAEAKGGVTFQASGESQGIFTPPNISVG